MPTSYPELGTVVDETYQLEVPLASGGMSRVYRALALKGREPVAVKVLDPRLAAHPYAIERFYREARVSLLLDHRNVVRVHTFGPTAVGHHVIVMDLLKGESLRDRLDREGSLEWREALRILVELSDVLGHAHGRRVVHRDIKPENIQLIPHADEHPDGDAGEPDIRLLDFGVAYVSADSEFREPAPGSTGVSGTPAYMSPEQIRGLPLDGRSDVYALGVLLFEMLTGVRPFAGDDPIDVCRAQLYERPPKLSDYLHGRSVPAEIHSLVRQMLTKSRSSRVASVGALLGRLMSILPKDRWPRGVGRQPARAEHTALRPATSRLLRRPTGEFFHAPADLSVTVLQIGIDAGDREVSGVAGWPPEVDSLLAGWRGLVEESGGLVHQPEPHEMRIIFGLFRPSRRAADVWEAVLHAFRLRDLCRRNRDLLPGLAARAAVLRARTVDVDSDDERETGLDPQDIALVSALVRATPPGAVSVDAEGRELLEDYAYFSEARTVLAGTRGEVPAYIITRAKV